MIKISKNFKTMKQAEKFHCKLYDDYEYVRLIFSPLTRLLNEEKGLYVWNVENEKGTHVQKV